MMTETAQEPEEAQANLRWFVLRVQSNREESVRENLGKLLERIENASPVQLVADRLNAPV